MKVSATKGISPRGKLYSQIDVYRDKVNLLLTHSRPANNHPTEIRGVKDALRYAAEAVFQHLRRELMKQDPGVEAPVEARQRFNDSVSYLRTLHGKTMNKIASKKYFTS